MPRPKQEYTPHRIGLWPWLALLLGVLVGSIVGFSVRPTQISGASTWDLQRSHKQDYLMLLSDLYAADGNAESVRNRLRGWRPEDVAALLAEMEASSNDAAEIARLSAMREITGIPAAEPTFLQLLRSEPLIMFSLGASGIVLLIAGAVGLLVSTEQERLSRILAQAIQERAKAYPQQQAPTAPPPDLRALADAINKTNNAQLGKLLQPPQQAQAAEQPAPQQSPQPESLEQQQTNDQPQQQQRDFDQSQQQQRSFDQPPVQQPPFQSAPPAPQAEAPEEDPLAYTPPTEDPPSLGLLASLKSRQNDAAQNRRNAEPELDVSNDAQYVQPESELARMMQQEAQQQPEPEPAPPPPLESPSARQQQQIAAFEQSLQRTNQPPPITTQNVQQTVRPLPSIEPPPQRRQPEPPPVYQPQQRQPEPPPVYQPPQPAYQPPQQRQPEPPQQQPVEYQQPPIVQQTTPLPRRAPPPPPPPPPAPKKASLSDENGDSKAKIGEILADVFIDEGLLQKQALLHGLVMVDVHQLLNQAVYMRQQLQSKAAANAT